MRYGIERRGRAIGEVNGDQLPKLSELDHGYFVDDWRSLLGGPLDIVLRAFDTQLRDPRHVHPTSKRIRWESIEQSLYTRSYTLRSVPSSP